jgi:hypothetical protein
MADIITRSQRLITTKYLGPTNHKGSRVKATMELFTNDKVSVVVSWDYEGDTCHTHDKAALALLNKVRGMKGFECWCRDASISRAYYVGGYHYCVTFDK